jgi:hypothetical protein
MSGFVIADRFDKLRAGRFNKVRTSRFDKLRPGLIRHPWMPDQVRHDNHFSVIADLIRNPWMPDQVPLLSGKSRPAVAVPAGEMARRS